MDTLISLLEAATKAGPLVLLCLITSGLGFIIYTILPKIKEYDKKYEVITTNHLHDLPMISANLEKAVEVLQRMEVKQVEEFSYIRTKLDAKR